MCKYISKYSNGKEVSAAQYITEIICEKWAKITGSDIHYRFWLNEKWQKHYKQQIPAANKLLKKYSAKAIIEALKDKKTEKTYSLRSQYLVPIIERHEKIIASQNKELTKDFERKKEIKFAQKTSKRNIISKLKDLDNE